MCFSNSTRNPILRNNTYPCLCTCKNQFPYLAPRNFLCWSFLQILLTEATNHRQNVEKMAEEQKNKYLGLSTILPSELSLQLAEVALDLETIHDQVNLQSRKSSFPFFIGWCSCIMVPDFQSHVTVMETEFKNRSVLNNNIKWEVLFIGKKHMKWY